MLISTSIIIPAHDEQAGIARCLRALVPGLESGQFEVIVVCNGCTDETAAVAGQCHHRVRVMETPVLSKANALNLGDQAASAFPRIYLDADVQLDAESVHRLVAALRSPDHDAAAPRAATDLTGCSWPVRAFYRVWTNTPYFKQGMIGCGVYALSERGRAEFERFPDLIADDGYVRAMFSDGRMALVPEAEARVLAPRRWGELVKVMTRSRLGGLQLARHYPDLVAREQATKDYGESLRNWLARPTRWPHVLVYVLTNLLCRWRARRQLARNQTTLWERDMSTRSGQ